MFYVTALILLIVSTTLHAQGRATVFGTVTDPTKAAIPGAQIVLTENDTHQTIVTQSTDVGNYVFSSILPGTYRLRVSAPGFQTSVVNNIVVQIDESRQISPVLALGVLTSEVTVTEGLAQVDTHEATINEVVDADRVKELPLNGRNPLDLQELVAGAAQVTAGGGGQAQNNVIAINGARADQVNYTLDGVDNEDPFFDTPSVEPNPDALDQFSIETTNYGAREGRGSGGQMNAITKSGTNQFHGSSFYYVRNQAMDAAGYFALSVAPYRRNQFGGTIGGPILHNRLFLFAAYQGTRINSSPSSLTTQVPDALELQGNFSQVSTVVKDPATGKAAPGNIIPSTSVSPIAQAWAAAFIPTPNAGLNAYTYHANSTSNDDQYVIRLDSNIKANDTLAGRFLYDSNPTLQINGSTSLPGFLSQINYKVYSAAVNETHVFGPKLVNLFIFGFNDIAREQVPVVPLQKTWGDFGSAITRAAPTAQIGYNTTVTGFFTSFSRWPLNQYRHEFQYSDLATWSIRNHALAFGGDIRQSYVNQYQTFNSDGVLTFGASYTGYALADFVTGKLNVFNQESLNQGEPQSVQPDFFLQDDWRVTRRLTLNLGIRWEPFVPLHDVLNRYAQFRPGQQSTVFPTAPAGYVFPGDAGVPTNTYNGKWGEIGPRVGFAYDVYGDGKTSLRGGIGIYNASVREQILNNESLNSPYALAISASKPTGGLANPYSDIGGDPFPFTPAVPGKSGYIFSSPLGTIYDFDPNFQNGRAEQWNLNLQQQLPSQIVATIAYVGANGGHLTLQTELDPAVYGKAGSTTQARRVYAPNFSSMTRTFSGGHSSYSSLQVTINKRVTQGLTVLTSYTWERSIDNGSTPSSAPFNPFNLRSNRAVSDFDIPQVFVSSFVYSFPSFGTAGVFSDLLIKGWKVNGILRLEGGTPFTVVSGVDNSQSGVNADTADVIGVRTIYKSSNKAQEATQYFNTAAYKVNAVGTFGNSGRNSLIGPGFENIDFGLIKAIPMHNNRYRAEIRAEAFNLFNHTNLGNPVANVSTAFVPASGVPGSHATGFGAITSQQGAPRQVQLAARFEF